MAIFNSYVSHNQRVSEMERCLPSNQHANGAIICREPFAASHPNCFTSQLRDHPKICSRQLEWSPVPNIWNGTQNSLRYIKYVLPRKLMFQNNPKHKNVFFWASMQKVYPFYHEFSRCPTHLRRAPDLAIDCPRDLGIHQLVAFLWTRSDEQKWVGLSVCRSVSGLDRVDPQFMAVKHGKFMVSIIINHWILEYLRYTMVYLNII